MVENINTLSTSQIVSVKTLFQEILEDTKKIKQEFCYGTHKRVVYAAVLMKNKEKDNEDPYSIRNQITNVNRFGSNVRVVIICLKNIEKIIEEKLSEMEDDALYALTSKYYDSFKELNKINEELEKASAYSFMLATERMYYLMRSIIDEDAEKELKGAKEVMNITAKNISNLWAKTAFATSVLRSNEILTA